MCSDTAVWKSRLDAANIGVFAYRNQQGVPVACAVTPYIDDGVAVVTSTLALPAKAAAARREGAAALLAGGVCLRGRVEVTVDRSSREFDRWVRVQELRKYPPAKSLLAIPGHRRLFPWYVGRVFIRFVEPTIGEVDGDDRCTLTTLDPLGVPVLSIAPEPPADPASWEFAAEGDGGACVLVHEETDGMEELRQLRIDGDVVEGLFRGTQVSGSLEPQETGARAELEKLYFLRDMAKANASVIDRLDQPIMPTGGRAS